MARITRKRKGSYHHGNLREAILAAAFRVVDDEGATALTTRNVAERLGVTHAAIYHHFEDRNAMLAALGEQALDSLAQAITTSQSANALEHFYAMGVAYLNFSLAHPRLYMAVSGLEVASQQRHAGLDAARGRVFAHLRAAIVACQKEGFVKPGSPEEHTLFCWSAVHGLVSLVAEGQTRQLDLPSDPKVLGEMILKSIFVGIATPEAVERNA
ncbi:MAG: TetR/AcrR family transcriptional regulator [Polyangiaceae bacterium]|nr:TetR/AcrR family transcriptional regulator [Polyangiaceae bacterium]